MADIRSLLRNERASRRINHPHASYTESGKLLCNVCALQIKTESLWENHVKSPQHTLRLQQARDNPPPSKKRKAGDDEDEGRKRVKGVPDNFFEMSGPEPDVNQGDDEAIMADTPAVEHIAPLQNPTLQPSAPPAPAPNIDEYEWAAFERDMAATEQPNPAAINTGAVISAAPMSAEEIAAQAREEQSVQRGRREAEIEAEKEDADLALLDEFDEMEELEDRVRRLREKREALRKAREAESEILPDVAEDLPRPSLQPALVGQEDEDEDDEDDDFDDWKFGAN